MIKYVVGINGALADALGSKTIQRMADDLAKEVGEQVTISCGSGGVHHTDDVFIADPPPPQPVRLIKLSVAPRESWMVQGRFGKNHDGEPFNAAGGSTTFPTQDAAKDWLMSEPAGRWSIVL